MVPRPTRRALRGILDGPPGLRCTLHVAQPERPGFDELRALPKRIRGTARAAVTRARELGVDPGRVARLEDELNESWAEPRVLPRGARGLVVTAGPAGLHAFRVGRPVRTTAFVGRTHRVRPLLRELRSDRRFGVLVLTTHRVELYEGDGGGLERVESDAIPPDLARALGTELTDSALQLHSTASHGGQATWHGQGGADRGRSVDLERFHRLVARGLERAWAGRAEPLVLAADAAQEGRFRRVVHLDALIDGEAVGNPEGLTRDELFTRTRSAVRAWSAERDRRAHEKAVNALVHGGAKEGLRAVATATVAGRVSRLWVDADRAAPSHVDPERGRLVEVFGDEDALDEIAALAATRGADVIVREGLEQEEGVLAELRGGA